MDVKIVAASVLLIIIVAVVSAFFIPPEEPLEYIRINRLDTKIDSINESHVDLIFYIEFDRSDLLQNTSLNVRIFDLKRDLLISSKYIEIPKENGHKMDVEFSFEKIMDYRILFEVEKERNIISTRSFNLRHLDTLIPEKRRLDIALRSADFKIIGIEDNDVEFISRFLIESKNDYEVDFRLNIIHFESKIMVYEEWVELMILKNVTNMVEYNFTVPDNHNYLVKLEAWRDGALIHTFERPLNLDPVRRIPIGVVEKEVEFKIEDLIGVRDRWAPVPPAVMPPYEHYPAPAAPGFSLLIGIISIGGVIYWLKKKQ